MSFLMQFLMSNAFSGFAVYTQNFKHPKIQKTIEVYSGDHADHCNGKWSSICSCSTREARNRLLWFCYVAIPTAKISFLTLFYVFHLEDIFCWNTLGFYLRFLKISHCNCNCETSIIVFYFNLKHITWNNYFLNGIRLHQCYGG